MRLNRDIFSVFFNMKVCCVFSLESPHRGDSNEYTQYTIFNMNKKNTINYPKCAATGFFSKGLKNEFETAVINEPSVFEPLKFYCIWRFFVAQICSNVDSKNYSYSTCYSYRENSMTFNKCPFTTQCIFLVISAN